MTILLAVAFKNNLPSHYFLQDNSYLHHFYPLNFTQETPPIPIKHTGTLHPSHVQP